jgi:hypothetical protein
LRNHFAGRQISFKKGNARRIFEKALDTRICSTDGALLRRKHFKGNTLGSLLKLIVTWKEGSKIVRV